MCTHMCVTILQQMELVPWKSKLCIGAVFCQHVLWLGLYNHICLCARSQGELQHSWASSWMLQPPQTFARGFSFKG